jgi:hypothetical protein
VHRRLSDKYSIIGEKREKKRKTELQAFLQAVDQVLEAEGLLDERAHVRPSVLELLQETQQLIQLRVVEVVDSMGVPLLSWKPEAYTLLSTMAVCLR